MIEENQDSSNRPVDQLSGSSDDSVAARVAQALGARVPDDLERADETPREEPERVPAPAIVEYAAVEYVEYTSEYVSEPTREPASAAVEPAAGQFDVSFEGAIRLLNERLAEVVRREAALGSKEQGVQQALAEADDRWAELEERRADVEQAGRELQERTGSVDQREAALALYEQELQQVSAHVERQRSELEQSQAALEQNHSALAELDQARRSHDDSVSGLAAREEALAQRELEAQRALADTGERERAIAEREAEAERNPAPAPALASADYEAQARALTEAVKAVAKQEAETVLKAAHDQARLILESAHAERETLTPLAPLGEHDD